MEEKMNFNKIFYDKQLQFYLKESDQYRVYSPMNNMYLDINKNTYDLIEKIIDLDGLIDFNVLKKMFFNTGLTVDKKVISNCIKQLIENKILFLTEKSLIESSEEFNKQNEISGNTTLKTAYLHITEQCNLNCWFCYNADRRYNERDMLNSEKWIEIIKKLYKNGVKEFIFTGGEPLMRSDLNKIISVKRDDMHFSIISNGILFTLDWIEQHLSKFDSAIISWGDQIFNLEALNERQKVLFKTLKNLDMVSRKKVSLRIIITHENIHFIKNLKKYLNNVCGFDNIIFQDFIPNNLDEVKYLPNISDLIKFEEDMVREKIEKNLFYLNKVVKCGALTSVLAIDSKGGIFPCQSFMGVDEFWIANIFDTDWYEKIKASEKREFFRKHSVNNREVCHECIFRNVCAGGCPAISYNLYGDLNHYPEYNCEYFQHNSALVIKEASL